MSNCNICNKKFPKRITILDFKYAFSNWRKEFDNHDCLFFGDENITTCISCGKNYYKWKYLRPNKVIRQLNKRSLTGKFNKIKIKPYDITNQYDICVICKVKTPFKMTDPIEGRYNYHQGIGQFCESCNEQFNL